MRPHSPFMPEDLADLDLFLSGAERVVSMLEVFGGDSDSGVIGMRHDVDNVITPAVAFAEWEAERGYRSTYFILHTAPYWQDKALLLSSLERIADGGHEIGIHNNAIAAALMQAGEPKQILANAVGELREYGFDITGTVAHGDQLCYDENRKVRFVNDEVFSECRRFDMGDAERTVESVDIVPFPLADLGLSYDANWIDRGRYISDSGGQWTSPFDEVTRGFPFNGQLHMLVHPDWWPQAFARTEIAA